MDSLMPTILWGMDIALVVSLCGVAWFTLASSDLFKAVVLFIVFGLLLSLSWLRLQAPDIALAEAALGQKGLPQSTRTRLESTRAAKAAYIDEII